MIKAIIFDFDYTLSNRGPAIYYGFSYLTDKYFPSFDEIEKEAIIQKMITLDEEGTISRTHIIEYFKNNYQIDMSDDFKDLSNIMAPYTILDDDAIFVLEYLKNNTNYKIGILTNGDIKTQRIKLEVTNVLKYVDEAVVSIESGYNKPDKRAYQYIADKLDIKCDECLFVGDIMFNDILGAYYANMHYLLLNNNHKRHFNKKIPQITKLKDLIHYLKV